MDSSSRLVAQISVSVDVQGASPNNRGHWRKLYRIKKAMREAAQWAWVAAGKPVSDVPVRYSILIRRARRIDGDNAIACCKPLIDGLFHKAVTPSDSGRWVTLGTVTQETGKKWKLAPEVVVTIEKL